MNFALDLLDTLADEAPEMVLPVVQQAAQSGEHLLVHRWVDEQVDGSSTRDDLGVKQPEFVRAMLKLSTFSDGLPATAPGAQAAKTFGHWAKEALEGHPDRPLVLGGLLSECVHSARPTMESAGRELLRLGANALSLARGEQAAEPVELAGVKVGLKERNATLLARALAWQHPLAGELAQQASIAKNSWPTVAEVEVDGKFHPVNAAAYCLVVGDMKMLKEVLARTQGDEHNRGLGLAQAVDFALASGLANRCTQEVAQGIALCVSAGADLDHNLIGQRLTKHRVTLAQEVSDMDASASGDYAIASLFISPKNGSAALSAISRLVNDYRLPINGSVTERGNQASLLHYAAASGHSDLVRGLIKLGADESAPDARGFTPKNWALMFDRPSTLAVLDPTAVQETPAVAPQPAQAPRAGAADEGPDLSDWHPDEGWFEEGAADDAAEQAMFSAQQAQVQDQPQKAAPAVDRDQVAPSMTQAQASKGAALFARLKVSQAEIATKSVSSAPQDKADEAPKPAPASTADSSGKRMSFRR
jgi:hypothetical protein